MKLLIAVLALALLASTSFAGTAGPDLTGTWTGKGSCSGLAVGGKLKAKVNVTLQVTDDTSLNKIAASTQYDAAGDVPFSLTLDGCGYVATLDGMTDEGRGALHGFDQSDVFGRFFTTDLTSVSVSAPDKKGRTGKIKATTFLADKPQELILSCKFKLDRTSTTDPGLSQCEEPSMSLQ